MKAIAWSCPTIFFTRLNASLNPPRPSILDALIAGEPDDLTIPDFLRRSVTPEQEEKLRKKYERRPDPGRGLKVTKPYEPPPEAIRKAIAKDFAE